MSELLIPRSARMSRSNPLREFLDSRDGRKFETQVALSDALSRAAVQTAKRYKMRNPELIDGLITALVSCVQAIAPHDEWGDVSNILTDVIQRRLTITGVT